MKSNYINILFFVNVMLTISIGNNLFGESKFSGERLKKACLDYIYDVVGTEAEVSISQNISDQVFNEKGIVARCDAISGSLRGNCYIAIEFKIENRLLRRLEIPVRVRIYRNIATSALPMARGDSFNKSNVIIEKKEITGYSENEIPTVEEIYGTKAKRNLQKGTILTRSLLERESIIHRGNKVSIVVQSGAITVRTTGEALQDAAIDENIRVKRDGAQTILQGYVTADGSVLIGSK